MMRKRILHEPIHFGPWQLGRWGLPVNIVAFVYTLIAMVFSFFPPAIPVTPVNMNWSVVVFSFVVISGLVYYAVFGRKQYKGPVMDRHDR
jgi:choline transport protein